MRRALHLAGRLAILFPLVEGLSATANWHYAKAAAHDELISVVRHALLHGPRSINNDEVHTEVAVGELPAEYGLPTSPPRSLLTPDIIAFDHDARELLVIECTIVPDAALPKYCGRKRAKYLSLCNAASRSGILVGPPAIVALGVQGTVPISTRFALARVLGEAEGNGSEALDLLMDAVRAAAARRPDGRSRRSAASSEASSRTTGTRRQRRRASRVMDAHISHESGLLPHNNTVDYDA